MLALLVAVTTTVVLTAVAGSRRGASAVDRLLERDEAGHDRRAARTSPGFDWEAIEAIDGVEAVGQFAVAPYVVDGLPEGPANFPYDAEVMHSIEAPVVLEGRLADPARDDEVVITPAFERQLRQGRRRLGDDPALLAGADRRRRGTAGAEPTSPRAR